MMNSLKKYCNSILGAQSQEILTYYLGKDYLNVPSYNYPKLVNEKVGYNLIDLTDRISDVFKSMKEHYNTNISNLRYKQSLIDIGFKEDSSFKISGLLRYNILDEEDNEVYIEVSTKRSDLFAYLVVNQYDWVYMEPNKTELPLNAIIDIQSLKTNIKILEKLFKNS